MLLRLAVCTRQDYKKLRGCFWNFITQQVEINYANTGFNLICNSKNSLSDQLGFTPLHTSNYWIKLKFKILESYGVDELFAGFASAMEVLLPHK